MQKWLQLPGEQPRLSFYVLCAVDGRRSGWLEGEVASGVRRGGLVTRRRSCRRGAVLEGNVPFQYKDSARHRRPRN